MTTEEIAERLGSNRAGRARCPVHKSKGLTLHISPGTDRTLLYCHAGCDAKDILAAIGLTIKDLYYRKETRAEKVARARADKDRAAVEYQRQTVEMLRANWGIVRACLGELLIRNRSDPALRELWHRAIRESLNLNSNPATRNKMWAGQYGEPEDWEGDRELAGMGALKPVEYLGRRYRVFEYQNIPITSKMVGKEIARYLRVK